MDNRIFFAVWLSGVVTMVCSIIADSNYWNGISLGIFIALLIQQVVEK